MTVSRLIGLFSSWTKVVEVEEISGQLVDWGYCSDIKIVPFDKSPEKLLGLALDYIVPLPYSAEKEIRVVRYNQNTPVDMQRLICVKELIHLLDAVALRVSSKRQLSDLLDEILHRDTDITSLGVVAAFEDIAVYQALAVLCPEDMREDIYEKYHAPGGNVSLADVAAKFVIPVEYAGYLMLPQWKSFRQKLVRT